jgi:hypothetical protein
MITVKTRHCLCYAALVLSCAPSSSVAAQSEKSKPSKTPAAKQEAPGWLLAGREGTCAPLALLEKRGAEFRSIEGPEDLANKMRAAGHKVEIKEHSLASPPAVEVRVPERALYVMFVRADLCKKMEGEDDAPAAGKQKQAR